MVTHTNLGILDDYKDTFKHVAMAKEEAIQLEMNNCDQNVNEKWHTEGKKHITALSFGEIMI